MENFSTEFATVLALVGVVIMIAALLSGLIERSNLPQVGIFLALGTVLGPFGLGLLDIQLDSSILRVIATLSLALVLFTDALSLDIREVRKHWTLAFRVLGPGTLLTAALIAAAGVFLLNLSVPAAVIVGAAISSTDPVMLRGLLRHPRVSRTARQALRLESGLNDVVLLPVVVVAMVFLQAGGGESSTNWGRSMLNLFLLGPGAGVAVGLLAVSTLDLMRRRIGVRRDYESLYSLGVAFAAFAAAEALHGSGFLAAFAAGLTISALDVELCDCFREYGETTSEMALLFTFVLFGSSLIWTGLQFLTVAGITFALLAILIRPAAFMISLLRTRLKREDRVIISWFGPRALSTLLLVLVPVFEGVRGGDRLFAICSLVVLASVLIHGGSILALSRRATPETTSRPHRLEAPEAGMEADSGRREQIEPVPILMPLPVRGRARHAEDTDGAPSGDTGGALPESGETITIAEFMRLREAGEPVVVVDARTERTHDNSDYDAEGAVRINPGYATRDIKQHGIPKRAWVVIFCA